MEIEVTSPIYLGVSSRIYICLNTLLHVSIHIFGSHCKLNQRQILTAFRPNYFSTDASLVGAQVYIKVNLQKLYIENRNQKE